MNSYPGVNNWGVKLALEWNFASRYEAFLIAWNKGVWVFSASLHTDNYNAQRHLKAFWNTVPVTTEKPFQRFLRKWFNKKSYFGSVAIRRTRGLWDTESSHGLACVFRQVMSLCFTFPVSGRRIMGVMICTWNALTETSGTHCVADMSFF